MKINVVQDVLASSEKLADANRARLDKAKAVCLNMMSTPGSGKTTLLQQTLPAIAPLKAAVLVGDLQTTRDAQRLSETGVPVTQINTGRGCHLSPAEVSRGLDTLDLPGLDLVVIENVGNMVCPAAFDLGEHLRVVLLSVPEGDDKVAKYPTLFQSADAVLVSKTDLIEHLGYDMDQVVSDLAKLNTAAPLIRISNKTGEGIQEWLDWLAGAVQATVDRNS